MNRLIYTVLFFMLSSQVAFSQGIRDSLFQIREVAITAERIFKKESAGMKETTVDSFVFVNKINRSLSELLSENTPVFIKSHGRGALATASFRGTAASHVQVEWNGINLNSPMTGMVDFSLIPVYVIDDMNLNHGAASIARQSGGLGGSISMNNTADWNLTFFLNYLQGIGSYSSFDEFLAVGGGNKTVQVKTRLYHNFSRNDYTFINRGIANIDPETGVVSNPLDTNFNADYARYGILQEAYFRLHQNSIVSAKYWAQWAQRTIPRATSYEGPDNSNLNDQADTDHKIVADWKRYFQKSKLVLRTAYSQKQLNYSLKNFVPGSGQVLAIDSKSRAKSVFNSAHYTLNLKGGFSAEGSLDVNYHDVDTREQVKMTGYHQHRWDLSAWGALRKNVGNRLNMNLMLRQNRMDEKFIPLVPFLGFDYRLLKGHDLLLKGNVARNYHQPSLNDLYWQPGGNPDLLPEKGISAELGAEYQKQIGQWLMKTEITAYRADIDNWIIWIPNYKGYWEPRNIERVLSQGLEWSLLLGGKVQNLNYKLTANYAYTPSINYGDPLVWGDASRGKQLVYVPLHSGNVLLHLSWQGFSASYQFNHYSERFTTSSNDVTRRDWLYPYFMNDLMVGKKFKISKTQLAAELKIYNLFNETYHSILYRPMPGRSYMFLLMVYI